MKKLLSITFIAMLSTAPAYAEGGHGHGGHYGGHGGYWGGGWIVPALIGGAIAYDLTYPHPVYAQPYLLYDPYPVYVQPAPVYSQPAPLYAPSVPPPSVPMWYFCAASNGYYPYVTSCPSGWQTVPATPPVATPNVPYGAPPR